MLTASQHTTLSSRPRAPCKMSSEDQFRWTGLSLELVNRLHPLTYPPYRYQSM